MHALLTQPLALGGRDRIVGRRKGKLVDHDERERLALYVDPLPEAHRAHENAVARLAEGFDERPLGPVALNEKRIAVAVSAAACRTVAAG